MNVNLKVILALIYVSCLGALLIFLFSYLDFKDLTDYNYIKTNSEVLLSYKEDNLFFFILFFFLFTIVWVFLLGFGSPIAILSGFIFGQLYGTLITLIGLTIGSTLLYTFSRYYFRNLIFACLSLEDVKASPQILKLHVALIIYQIFNIFKQVNSYFSKSQSRGSKCMLHKQPRRGIPPFCQEPFQSKLWVGVKK